jgi:RNA polymerase sigma-70 factor, ECF subfamily
LGRVVGGGVVLESVSESAQAELVERAVRGDRAALGDLLLAHLDGLERHVSAKLPDHIRSLVAPDDVVQEALVQAIRGIAGFQSRGPASFRNWLWSIADHEVRQTVERLGAQKRGGRRQHVPAATGQTSSFIDLFELVADSTAGTASGALAGQEAARAMQVGIAGLPDDQRRAVRLHFLEGRSLDDTAGALERSPGAVRGLLHRAKAGLRDALGHSSRWFARKP